MESFIWIDTRVVTVADESDDGRARAMYLRLRYWREGELSHGSKQKVDLRA